MTKSKGKSIKKKQKAISQDEVSSVHNWFDVRFRVLSISVLVLAGLLRIGLLMELPSMPFSQLHKVPDLDMNFFNYWGDRIAGGDILTDTILHPYHSWHAVLAEKFGAMGDVEGKKKWDEWYGGKQYHQEPFYPLIIGLSKMAGGDGLIIMYVLQMMLGLLSIWMMMWLGRHYFGAMAGILGGLIFTLYSPNLLFDATLLRTSFNTSLLIGMIFVAEKLMMGKSKPWIMGWLGGIGYLLMTTSMLLWIPLVARWLFVKRSDLKKSWQVAIAFGVVLSFLIARNSITGSPLMSASSVGPITYVLSNFPGYAPESGFAYFPSAGKILELEGGKMVGCALHIISKFPSIWDWVFLQFKKLGTVFHWYEIPNNINSYLARDFSLSLQVAFIPYSFIAAFGFLGIIMSLRNKKTLNLHIGILSQVAIMVIFYVLCRFRVPLVAMLAIFAGYPMQEMVTFHKLKKTLILAASGVALWLLILRPFPRIPVLFQKGDLTMCFQTYYIPQLDKYQASGDFQGAIDLLEELIGTMPEEMKDMKPVSGKTYDLEIDLINYYGLLYDDLGYMYTQAGNTAKAAECTRLHKKYTAVGK